MTSPYEHILFDEQVRLEHEMVDVTKASFWKSVQDARANRSEGDVGYGVQLMKEKLGPISSAIRATLEAPSTKGRPPRWYPLLRDVDPDVAAYIALKAVIDSISSNMPAAAMMVAVGARIEDQLRLDKFKEMRPDLFKLTTTRLGKEGGKNNRNRRKTVLRLMSNRAGIVWNKWTPTQCAHVGSYMTDLLIDAKIIKKVNEIGRGKYRGKTQTFIYPADGMSEWIYKTARDSEMNDPKFYPMVIPPKRYTNPMNGGYWSGMVPQLGLVKKRKEAYLEEMADQNPVDVYEAVNAVQETPWKINMPILKTLKEAVDRGAGFAGLPSLDDIPEPAKPHDIETNEAARKAWRKSTANVVQSNFKLVSKRFALSGAVQVAERFSKYERIWFPFQLDFRGRLYAMPAYLHPQGPDYTKALLTFSEGKPINDEISAGWLAVHGANVYGYDKVSLEDRISWVSENEELIRASASDPWGNTQFWTEASSPWQFLAFCGMPSSSMAMVTVHLSRLRSTVRAMDYNITQPLCVTWLEVRQLTLRLLKLLRIFTQR
jgi:DNA-directed RNA polymerase, mitochondrial